MTAPIRLLIADDQPIIRQAGQSGVNRDTMALVDKFLDRLF